MSNHFKHRVDREEAEQEVQPEKVEKAELPRSFMRQFFKEGVISKEAATDMLPFIIYMSFLAMIYIGNRHFAENNIRDIDKLNKEVKELSWEFKSVKADLMLKSTQTEVARMVDTLGLKEPVSPPIKIVVANDEY